MVFAVRDPNDVKELSGMPELVVGGLADNDARWLLASAVPGRLDEHVRDQIVAETRGNPLALLELPRGLTPTELAGGFGFPDARPLASRVEEAFVQRIRALPGETQLLLLVAAAEPVGDVGLLWRAAEQLGIRGGKRTGRRSRVDRIRDSGAVPASARPVGDVQGGVRRGSSTGAPSPRRSDRSRRGSRSTCVAPRERFGESRRGRSGRARALGRSRSTPGRRRGRGCVSRSEPPSSLRSRHDEERARWPPRRRSWRREVAGRWKNCSRSRSSPPWTSVSVPECSDCAHRSRSSYARQWWSTSPRRGRKSARTVDPALARETYLEALGAAMYAGRVDADSGVLEVAEAARAAPAAPQPSRSIDLVLDGMSRQCTEGSGAGVPALRLALDAYRNETLDNHPEIMRWLMLTPIVQSMTVFECGTTKPSTRRDPRCVARPNYRRTRTAPRRPGLPIRRARVRRGVRRGGGRYPRVGRHRRGDRRRGTVVRVASARGLEGRRAGSHEVHQCRPG